MRRFRSEPRTAVNLPADLSWEIGAGYVRNVAVTVRDTSKSGMALLAPLPFAVGATVTIKTTNRTGEAIVRRCVKDGTNHILGVEFQQA